MSEQNFNVFTSLETCNINSFKAATAKSTEEKLLYQLNNISPEIKVKCQQNK